MLKSIYRFEKLFGFTVVTCRIHKKYFIMKQLYRLVYTSARNAKCTDEEILKILDACKRNNPGKDITGVLLHSDKRFIQYLEGDKDEIKALYEKIAQDPRHGGVTERNYEPIAKRVFPDWHMGYKDVSSNSTNFHTDLTDEHKSIFKQIIEGGYTDFNDQGMTVLKMFFKTAN